MARNVKFPGRCWVPHNPLRPIMPAVMLAGSKVVYAAAEIESPGGMDTPSTITHALAGTENGLRRGRDMCMPCAGPHAAVRPVAMPCPLAGGEGGNMHAVLRAGWPGGGASHARAGRPCVRRAAESWAARGCTCAHPPVHDVLLDHSVGSVRDDWQAVAGRVPKGWDGKGQCVRV